MVTLPLTVSLEPANVAPEIASTRPAARALIFELSFMIVVLVPGSALSFERRRLVHRESGAGTVGAEAEVDEAVVRETGECVGVCVIAGRAAGRDAVLVHGLADHRGDLDQLGSGGRIHHLPAH